MSNSTKITESPRLQKFGIHSTPNNSRDDIHRSFTTPNITATPVRLDMYATPPRPLVLSPRRYSLSDIATPPRLTSRDSLHRSSYKCNISGPLLASTKFNVNVSTYEETKSPGLARRIVQYNNEIEKEKERQHPPTHQAKYGSPGLFPIVHLFKKDPPTLEQRPKRVKVRISSPGYTRQHSEDYKLKILEGIVKPRTQSRFSHGYQDHTEEASTSTRSVLDALKEISRKRIHASEEYDSSEDSGKRQRTDFLNGIDSNKRTRDDTSPLLDSPTSPIKPVSKKACMYDEYAASCSSTVYSMKRSDLSGSKRKSISTSTLIENPKETKHVKLITVETQTTPDEDTLHKSSSELQDVGSSQEDMEKAEEQPIKKRDSLLKVFDDAPLERIRKNRLAALMGSLTGKEPVLTPKPTFSSILNGDIEKSVSQDIQNVTRESDKTEKPLVSILTTNKLHNKTDKHVHFNIPETPVSLSNSEDTGGFSTSFLMNKVSTPISLEQPSDTNNKELSVIAPPSSPVALKPSDSNTKFDLTPKENIAVSLAPTFSPPDTSEQTNKDLTKAATHFSTSLLPASNATTAQFTFGGSSNSSTSTILPVLKLVSTNATSPTKSVKVGGFKFELSSSKPDISKATSVTGNITLSTPLQPSGSVTSFEKSRSGDSSLPTSPLKPTVGAVTTTSTGLTFGTTTTTSSAGPLTSSSASPFKFGGFTSQPNSKIKDVTNTVISTNITTNTITNNTFTFGGSKPNVSSSGTPSSNVPAFSFNIVKSTSSNAGIIPTSSFSFSAPKSTSLPVPANSTTINFVGGSSNSAVSNGSAINFGVSSSSSGIGSATSSFGLTTPSSFGTPTSLSVTTVSSNGFGTATSSISTFGSVIMSTSSFGASNTPSKFESPSTGFGLKATAASSFGVPINSTGFGGFGTSNKTSDVTSGNFGTTSASIFGSNKSVATFAAPVANTTSPPFGASSVTSSPFTNANVPTFGQTATPTPSFGTTTASFNANTFNNVSTTSSVFGGSSGFGTSANSSTNIFGGSTTAQPSGFGTTNSIFATTSTVSPFENTVTTGNSFVSNSAGIFSFGAKTTTASGNGFGANPTSTGGFGTTNAPSFGNTNIFGSSSNNFGVSNSFGSPNTPSFGAATTQSSGFPAQSGGFGAPSQGFGIENKPMFGNENKSVFVSENKTVFGNPTTPSFGTNTGAPVFGSNAPSTGFGTSNNSSTFSPNTNNAGFGKPQVNSFGPTANNFGSTSNGFGSNQSQAVVPFGNPNTPATNSSPVFNFGSGASAKPGVFSFGSAPSAGEPPKPNFNFTGGGSGTPAFGASSSFGGSGTFSGGPNPPQFGAPPVAAQNMFNIGTGSPSTRNRAMIRAKRRT